LLLCTQDEGDVATLAMSPREEREATHVKTTTMPYTSMLFVEHLVSSAGFAPWGKDIGAYSSNTSIPVNKGDQPLSYWKTRLVMEDPEYINEAYADVFEFISKNLTK